MTHKFGPACQVGAVAQTKEELGIVGTGIVTLAAQLLHKGAQMETSVITQTSSTPLSSTVSLQH